MRTRTSRSVRRRVVTHRVSGAASARRRGGSRSRSSSNPLAVVIFLLIAILLAVVVLQKPETGDSEADTELRFEREIEQLKNENQDAEVFNLN